MILKDIIKLTAAILIIFFLCYATLVVGQLENRKSKYTHPITRPGASW